MKFLKIHTIITYNIASNHKLIFHTIIHFFNREIPPRLTMKLNLEAKNREQQRIKAYLEKNASDILAGKINNGVRIYSLKCKSQIVKALSD